MNLTQKILNAHLVSGTPAAGEEVSIRIDQTLTQDSTGTMAYRAPWCRVMVGGAVLTEEYAKEIGADGYGRDAMASVRLAERFMQAET